MIRQCSYFGAVVVSAHAMGATIVSTSFPATFKSVAGINNWQCGSSLPEVLATMQLFLVSQGPAYSILLCEPVLLVSEAHALLILAVEARVSAGLDQYTRCMRPLHRS